MQVFITNGKMLNKTYNNNKFKISAPTWNKTFNLPDGLYNISEIQDYIEYIIKNTKQLVKMHQY